MIWPIADNCNFLYQKEIPHIAIVFIEKVNKGNPHIFYIGLPSTNYKIDALNLFKQPPLA